MYRVGQGFDIHRLVEGRKLLIGGVEIPYHKGFLAHSDGDVLLHAITDALLGSIGERDIGYHYPDTSEHTRNMDSRLMLREVLAKVKEKGYKLINIDATIIANKPKLQPYVEQIRESLSSIVGISKDNISIKAKTTEGFFFDDDGMMVFAVVLIEES
ncbi:MAG: 2-C-methyl-D-erythritol 2,4-cyclodiphosphate synthase [Spirochaetia bacterium]|nr:2-C-methyl-D-erythritol 2,4-cyclodiphosphate synthase [Spirochaetota bacterium]MCX8097039.1 2-C-methyl-D-erythritol 2,4-cyclodiphosphate synthase [Spirochaetota bacterium]MDW8111766.1 2-C-methyl-D-erythritol 2,4-cyclodiphosphate synthase [Spirochaetia bacterium]